MLRLNQYNLEGKYAYFVSRALGLIINIMITNVYKLIWQLSWLADV